MRTLHLYKLWCVVCGVWCAAPIRQSLKVAINYLVNSMKIKTSIESEWTYSEFITVLLSLDRSTEAQQYLEWLLENQTSTVTEKFRRRDKEINLSLGQVSRISRITDYLSESIPSYTTDRKLSIVFWMRVGIHLSAHYSENIDNLIKNYCEWKDDQGRDYVLIAKQKNNTSKDASYSLDAFISRGAFKDKSKAIPEENWKIIKATLLEIKPKSKKQKDPFQGIGKNKYTELKKVIEIEIERSSINNLRSKTGPSGKCEYNSNREELYRELLEKYKLTLTISSFKKAIGDFVKCYPKLNMPNIKNKKDAFLHQQSHKNEEERKKITSLDNIKRLSE
ncbi:MAG: hypothetical protein RSE32_07815 [Comamonas sp.]|uniref:hypothetical protein n=1 Tax=Comamonas sp. TaxID=34028 RepID=UPI002FC58408